LAVWHVTALRGAATLRGRRSTSGGGHGQNERVEHSGSALSQDDLDFDFNHARSRAALAKGDEMLVAMPDGECLPAAALLHVVALHAKAERVVLARRVASRRREVEAPHGVGGVEQARRDRAADQEDEPRHGLLPRKRK